MLPLYCSPAISVYEVHTNQSINLIPLGDEISASISKAEIDFLEKMGSSFTIQWILRNKIDNFRIKISENINDECLLTLGRKYKLKFVRFDEFKELLISAYVCQKIKGHAYSLDEIVYISKQYMLVSRRIGQ